MMKVFAQPNGGSSYTNANGERVRYTTTSRQGRFYERTGRSGIAGGTRTSPTRAIRQVATNRVVRR